MWLCCLSWWVKGRPLPSGGFYQLESPEDTEGKGSCPRVGALWCSQKQGDEVSSQSLLADPAKGREDGFEMHCMVGSLQPG